jgi:hypothetical protein
MADYHPLISRAVAGLENNTGENRRVLYERARAALVNQLRGIDPPLEESDITRERLALEEAIRKVEAEAAKRPEVHEEVLQAPPSALHSEAMRGFRDTVGEADSLGGAAAQARRSAREFYEAVPGGEQRPPANDGESGRSVHYFEPLSVGPPTVNEPDVVEETPPLSRPRPYEMPEDALPPVPSFDEHHDYVPPVRSRGRIVKLVVLLSVVAGIAGAGYWQRDRIMTTVASLRGTTAPKPHPATPPRARPKIADRISESDNAAPKTATAPAAAVAQKVVLYDEEPGDPKGKRYVGSAIWRTETVSPGPGLAPELAVRADVEIPERHMRLTWSLRRNTDKALPASHTIEIQFTLPADFDQGSIGNVPGVLMKTGEQARGIPLAGLAVKVTNGYFLIGLSAVDIDKQRNIQMLKDRDWLDIPIVYTSGKRAILAIEKGTPGQRAFDEAFRAWGE